MPVSTAKYVPSLGILFASISLVSGTSKMFSCDSAASKPLCPGTLTTCTCTVAGAANSNTRWRFFSMTDFCLCNFISLSQPYPCAPMQGPSSTGVCGPYLSAANRNPGSGLPCNVSYINITAHPSLKGMLVGCQDMSAVPDTWVGNVTLSIVGKPHARQFWILGTCMYCMAI